MVVKMTLGQIFYERFGFSCQFLVYQILHTNLSSGAGTIGQTVAGVPRGLSLTPPQEIKKLINPDITSVSEASAKYMSHYTV
jgi:hypothetical protein